MSSAVLLCEMRIPAPEKEGRCRGTESNCRNYDLRHTSATLLLKEGVNVKIVPERLGHANIGTTLDTYAHVSPSMQQQAADGIDAALFRVG